MDERWKFEMGYCFDYVLLLHITLLYCIPVHSFGRVGSTISTTIYHGNFQASNMAFPLVIEINL